MKKTIIPFLSITMALMLSACSGSAAPATEATTAAEQTTTEETTKAPETTTEPAETEPEFDPSLGVVVMGKDNVLKEPVVIYDGDDAKITFVDSKLNMDGDEYFSMCVWEPTYTVENKTSEEMNVEVTFPYESDMQFMDYINVSGAFVAAPGETVSFTGGAVMIDAPDGGNARPATKYADYEQVPVQFMLNGQKEIRATVMATTIGGPYEDEPEVDYTGMFALEITGEPYIRQTAKGPDYFTYAVDILFTNNSDMTVVVDIGQVVAPGETVTVQSNIAKESGNPAELDPHQEYKVTVFKEEGGILTTLSINY